MLENYLLNIFSNSTMLRDEILDTALEQFLKNGIREMSIRKLVAPLGISTKTVYKYFKNKEELLEEVLNLYYTQQYILLENLSADQKVVSLFIDIWYKAIEIAYDVNNVFFHDLHYYYPELERKLETTRGQEIWKQFIRIVERGMNDGTFLKEINPEVVLEGLAILYNAVSRTEKYTRFQIPPHEIFLNSIAIYIRGFCTPKGIQEIDEYMAAIGPSGVSGRI